MKKGFAPILILILILIIAGVGAAAFYFGKNYSKTTAPTATESATTNTASDETKDWATYDSSKDIIVKFTLKHPPEWSTSSPGAEDIAAINFSDRDDIVAQIIVTSNQSKIPDLRSLESTKSETVTVDGITATKTIGKLKNDNFGGYGGIGDELVVIRMNNVQGSNFTFAMTLSNEDSLNIFNQILSTFKFTE